MAVNALLSSLEPPIRSVAGFHLTSPNEARNEIPKRTQIAHRVLRPGTAICRTISLQRRGPDAFRASRILARAISLSQPVGFRLQNRRRAASPPSQCRIALRFNFGPQYQ